MRYHKRIRKTYQKKRSIIRTRFFRYFILFFILFVIIFYIICFSSFFQIKDIEISGNQKVSTEDIHNLVKEKLPKKILFLNLKSIFLANFKETENSLLSEFSQIEKVDFNKDLPDKLIILIEERKPSAVFFRNEEYFYLDNYGIIFEKIPEKFFWLVIKNLTLGQDVNLGGEAVKKERLDKILEINSELKKSEIQIDLAEIVNEQRVNVKTSEGWEIYFSLEDDISQQVSNLILVLKEKISSIERRNLEYVDLRFGNQVYYK